MASWWSKASSLILFVPQQWAICAWEPTQKYLYPSVKPSQSTIAFSKSWETLGPFRVGTREAIWGADPLEAKGGFPDLVYSVDETFRSPLTTNASLHWSSNSFQISLDHDEAVVKLSLDYDEVDWAFMQRIYGWSALQFQAWTRGELWNAANTTIKVALYPTNILEFWLNDQHVFGGDFYGFNRAPVIASLLPGNNVLNIRLLRDVRAIGGKLPPVLDAQLRVRIAGNIHISPGSITIPDVIENRFASSYASVRVCNQGNSWISALSLYSINDSGNELLTAKMRIAPGQSRPLSFLVDSILPNALNLTLRLEYENEGQAEISVLDFDLQITKRCTNDPHKITFLHPGGSVSYAILRPPSSPSHRQETTIPVLLGLHGAGLDADSHQVRHALDAAPDLAAWVLYPTGMSPWSGDDWHSWGLADVQAAIQAIPEWIVSNHWQGPGVDLEKYIVTGHSNGGQGTWFIALHQPDRVIAAAPASGYSSIENYVPYSFWGEADPLQTAILNNARGTFRHELLMETIQHIPILVQHGQDDDNVPAYHSRLMTTLASQFGSLVDYVELPHQGHWFEGAMTTPALRDFYERHLSIHPKEIEVPKCFAFVFGNSDDFGSRNGISVDQLKTPDRMGRITVEQQHQINITFWQIKTSNVQRLHFSFGPLGSKAPEAIQIDDNTSVFLIDKTTERTSFVVDDDGMWRTEREDDWRDLKHRFGRQRGAMDAIMRTRGIFQIVYCSPATYNLALQTSRNLLQYFGADSTLLSLGEYDKAADRGGNVIMIILGNKIPDCKLSTFPISLGEDELYLRGRDKSLRAIRMAEGLGGAWLRPLPAGRLELMLWGWDRDGLRQAVRMAPTLTGAGQPDFVIFGKEARWKGHGGAIAMGFLDHRWMISLGSFLP